MKPLFSAKEQKLLKVLGRRKMMISDITIKFYQGKTKPINATVHIASTIRRINMKCDFYGKSWSLVGEGAGRNGKIVWRQPKA